MSVSGACIINKISGMVYIKEDVTPSVLEWKAIDAPASIVIELNSIKNLQATKDGSPKMIIKITYTVHETGEGSSDASGKDHTVGKEDTAGKDHTGKDHTGKEEKDKVEEIEKDVRLTFNNRPTMNNIKECLQTIVSRQRTTIDKKPENGSSGGSSGSGEIQNISLSDEHLLKNHELQQKLLNEDKNLRKIFTQSVINFKLSPNIFWLSRLNILRTYALTISQHRGMYNVLSTIKPVASSDNKVHVNVTRNIINEIFDTYPVVQKAFKDLVPIKFQEGEFWSRFFNSKLFRRLRGDKINIGERGDLILDQYLTIIGDFKNDRVVEKVIDLSGNEGDNSTKLGNAPDFTMKYQDINDSTTSVLGSSSNGGSINLKENEMIILLKNMNNLSSKMVNSIEDDTGEENFETKEIKELEINDLNNLQEEKFIDLKINFKNDIKLIERVNPHDLKNYLKENLVGDINLIDIIDEQSINDTASKITTLIKLNFKKFKTSKDTKSGESLISNDNYQKLINLNITVVEFLSHFWSIFLNFNNPNQLKKIFTILKNCKGELNNLKNDVVKGVSEKVDLKDQGKVIDDLNYYLSPITGSLDKALLEYVKAVKGEVNENGKRPLES